MKVIAIWTQSLDGIIARDDHDPLEWRSDEDREWFHTVIQTFDASIVGRKTYDRVGRPTVGRRRLVCTKDPHLLASPKEHNRSYYSGTPAESLRVLANEHLSSVAVLGGKEIYTQFFQSSCVHELWVTICPIILGHGVRSTQMTRPRKLIQLDLQKLMGGLVVCKYRVL